MTVSAQRVPLANGTKAGAIRSVALSRPLELRNSASPDGTAVGTGDPAAPVGDEGGVPAPAAVAVGEGSSWREEHPGNEPSANAAPPPAANRNRLRREIGRRGCGTWDCMVSIEPEDPGGAPCPFGPDACALQDAVKKHGR